MSESLTAGGGAALPGRAGAAALERWAVPDARRNLQLALGAIWLLDAVLQYQPFMFTRAFGQMLAATAHGNPALIAGPITWSARLAVQHGVVLNTIYTTIQLLLGIGIAWRPTVKIALGASVVWALGVWWFGEGLGMVLTGGASPVSGAPGAVIIYALLAVLLWPAAGDRAAPFVAGRAVGAPAARVLWLILWASLAYFALQPASRAPQAISGMISAMAPGQPGWLAWTGNHAASLLSHHGLLASMLLAAACAVVAAGAWLPARAARAALVLAVAVAAAIWIAEGLGGIFTGAGTDPNSGPLLILLALAYWPQTAAAPERPYPAHSPGSAPPAPST